MEMQFAAEILRGIITTADLNDQELEVQAYYFFSDSRPATPSSSTDIEAIYQDMLARRIVIGQPHARRRRQLPREPARELQRPEMLAQAMEAADKVFEKVMELGGAVSGEHGIGITKIAFLSEDKIAALRAYKQEVDPKDILNPGKLVTRGLDVEPYTFSFNRLIRDIKKTALPDKDKLINLLAHVQVCTRCGKCKQVCPMYNPERGLIYHPRNKNISLGALIEAIYYSQVHHGRPSQSCWSSLRKTVERCTTCGKCTAACPVKIKTAGATLTCGPSLRKRAPAGTAQVQGAALSGREAPGARPPGGQGRGLGPDAVGNRLVGLVPGPLRGALLQPPVPGARAGHRLQGTWPRPWHLDKGSIFVPAGTRARPCSTSRAAAPGCSGAIGLAAILLLLRAGVAVVLPERHLCCGYPLLASGYQDAYRKNRARNIEAIGELFVQGRPTRDWPPGPCSRPAAPAANPWPATTSGSWPRAPSPTSTSPSTSWTGCRRAPRARPRPTTICSTTRPATPNGPGCPWARPPRPTARTWPG